MKPALPRVATMNSIGTQGIPGTGETSPSARPIGKKRHATVAAAEMPSRNPT
jgi:hypothetical protein